MNNRISRLAAALIAAAAAGPAAAALEIAATTTSMAMLARAVGGEQVSVTLLAPPDRDVHYLQARPSMMRALRGAELVVAVGGGLEAGWLPAALRGANNRRIQPGSDGYFEASARVELLGAGQLADRARGDVHPGGNPHVQLDPLRLARIGEALAERLASLEPGGAEAFRRNAEAFTAAVRERLPGWRERASASPGVLLYHPDGDYLLERMDIPHLGYVEAAPGVPPSGAHLRGLTERLAERRGVILRAGFHPAGPVRSLAERLGWPHFALALDPPVGADAEAYFGLIDRWVTASTGRRP